MSVSSNDSPPPISPATPPPPPPQPTAIDVHTNASPPANSSPLTPVSPSPSDTWSVNYHAVAQSVPLEVDYYHALFPSHPFLTPPPTSDSDYLERSYGQPHHYSDRADVDPALDIAAALVMSPKEVLHPSPFPYPGGEQHPQQPLANGGVSSERSTVSDSASRAHGEQAGWPPKTVHPSGAMAHAPPTPGDAPAVSPHSTAAAPISIPSQAGSMLPPIRMSDARPPSTPINAPNGHAQYATPYAYGYNYTPVQNAAGQTMYWHPPSNNGGGDPYTPGMTPMTGFGMHPQQHGTIQPSAFNGWADREREEERPGIERRESSTSTLQDRYLDKPLASPGMSQHSGEELVMVEVIYTSDCEVKQTQDVRRRCHNCSHTQPPSWRKSVLFPGKILCNKCGIFERTHRKSRPQQTDDQKLRKSTGYGQVEMLRANPSPMRFSKEEPQSPQSPYSVPSQMTPVSATSGFSSPISGHMPRRGSTSTSQPFSSPFAAGELRSVSFHPYQRPPISPSFLISRRAASYAYPAQHGGYYAPSPTYASYTHMQHHAYHQPGTPRELPAGPGPLMGTPQSASMPGAHAHPHSADAQMMEEPEVKPIIPAGPSTAGTMPPPEAHWPSRRQAEAQVHSAQ